MTQLQFEKELLLGAIFIEIEEGVVMVQNLKRLENLVEIIHKQGHKVPESVKKAYCDVAVDCTARCLAQKRDAKEAFVDAIRSIWLRRIMPLCDEVSCLVTRDLLNSLKRLWKAYTDEEVCQSLKEENTRYEALVSLRRLVSELNPDPDFGYDGRIMYMAEVESSQEAEPMLEVYPNSNVSEPQENYVANPNTGPKLISMELKTPPHSYEGKDSTDEEVSDDGERNNNSKRRSIVESPLESKQSSERGSIEKVPWSAAETQAVLEGYEKHGANWKQIKEEYLIVVSRPNSDIEDKVRVDMRREELHP